MTPGREAEDNELGIRLFGGFEATIGNRPVEGLQRREGARLLAFLALNHGRAIAYRTLAERFWPAEARRGREDFPATRQAIRSLRVALGRHAGCLESPAKATTLFNPNRARVDVVEFERLVRSGRPADCCAALALYRCPLLSEWEDAWAIAERARYHAMACKCLEPALEHSRRGGDAGVMREMLMRGLDLHPESDRLREELEGLESPAQVSDWIEARTAASGGAVPVDSPLYVVRPVDMELVEAIERGDSTVLIKGAHQMGKSSLLARGAAEARRCSARVAMVDVEAMGAPTMASDIAFGSHVASAISEQLELDVPVKSVWRDDLDANMNLERFLKRHVLADSNDRFVLALDGVDRLFEYPFGTQTFALFRSWHNRRALEPTGPWSRLTLVIAYATEPHLFITNLNQSPFNVGTRLSLDDFTPVHVAELNRRFCSPLTSEDELSRFYGVVNGHPYLVSRGLWEMAARGMSLEELEFRATRDDGPFGDHLRGMLVSLQRDAAAMDAVRQVLQKGRCPGLEWLYRLRSGGILKGVSLESCEIRCRLYADYLGERLLA